MEREVVRGMESDKRMRHAKRNIERQKQVPLQEEKCEG